MADTDQSLSCSYKIRVAQSLFLWHVVLKAMGPNLGGTGMAWTKPIIREIECGMEINMYGPDSDDEREVLF